MYALATLSRKSNIVKKEVDPDATPDYYASGNEVPNRNGCWERAGPKLRALLRLEPGTESNKPAEDHMRNPLHHEKAILPVRMYLHFSMFCHDVIFKYDQFNYFIIFVIIVAGILIGVQTYPGMDSSENPTIYRIDMFILAVFILEIAVKLVMEGLAPWRYFVGDDWKWNCFDFCIVFLSFPQWGMFFRGGSIKLLRLIRLARLGKLIKKIPPLQMIIKGLIGGLSSIVYIMLLLFLVFYIYGVLGYYLFSDRDKFHFGTLPSSMFTLFRFTLFDNEGDIFWVNMLGCMNYPDLYVLPAQRTPQNVRLWCRNSEWHKGTLNQIITAAYFISFLVIAGFVMLSLFIGAVTLSMNQSMDELKRGAEERQRLAAFEANKAKMEAMAARSARNSTLSPARPFSPSSKLADNMEGQRDNFPDEVNEVDVEKEIEEAVHLGELDDKRSWHPHKRLYNGASKIMQAYLAFRDREEEEEMEERKKVMGEALQVAMGWTDVLEDVNALEEKDPVLNEGSSPTERIRSMVMERIKGVGFTHETATGLDESKFSRMGLMYMRIAIFCKSIVESSWFTNMITSTIIAASLLVAAQEDARVTNIGPLNEALDRLDRAILTIFTVEVVLKMIGEKFKPWHYFHNSWNCFDFIVVVGCYVPGAGSTVTILRLLRLLRVLKLVKRLPQLAVIVDALMNSVSSVGYIGLILLLFVYVSAILAMLLFSENDPWHYGSLHLALISLFREITLDNWSHNVYINIYGCDVYADVYEWYPGLCTTPSSSGFVAGLFNIVFTIIGAQILLSLFIGVICTGMEESQQKKRDEIRIDKAMAKKAAKMSLSPERIEAFRTVFALLDLDNGGSIEEEELKIGLEAINQSLPEETIKEYLSNVDEEHYDDKTGAIDVVGFVTFMSQLPTYRKSLSQLLNSMKVKVTKKKETLFDKFYSCITGGMEAREEAMQLEAALVIQHLWRRRQAKREALAEIERVKLEREERERRKRMRTESFGPGVPITL